MISGARRRPVDFSQPLDLALRVLLVLLVLASVFALDDRPLILSAAAVMLVVSVAVLADQRLVVPLIIVLLPLEISGRIIPVFETEATSSQEASALNLARVGILAGALLFTIQAPREWWRDLSPNALWLPVGLLGGLYVLALTNSHGQSGAQEDVARLTIHIAFFFLIVAFVRDRQTLRLALMALVVSGLVLALIGLFQQLTDSYLWNEEGLRRLGDRRNATFVNSNFYARFLVISMVVAAAMFFRERSRFSYVLFATFALAALALPFTSSRSNWIGAVVLLPLVVLLLPISASTKLRSIAIGAAVALILVGLAMAVQPSLVDRVSSIGSADEVLGQRSFLWRAGWEMFKDHPLFGVGLDGFDDQLAGPYSDISPERSGISHNSVVTVMSELGILGLMVFGFLLYRIGWLSWRLYDGSAEDKVITTGLVAAFLAIFLHSQFGERFLEDPYLWLVLGLMAALWGIRLRESQEAGEKPPA